MIVAQIIELVLRKSEPVISQPSISTPILSPEPKEQGRAADTSHHVERKPDTESLRIPWRMARDEHVLRNERGRIAASDLERGTDDASVARAQVVEVPDHEDGHENVHPGRDCEHAEVARADGVCLSQFNRPSDRADGDAQHAERVSVLEPVADPRDGDGQDDRDHEDGDGVDLGCGRFVAQLGEDGGLEGDDGGSGVVCAEVG